MSKQTFSPKITGVNGVVLVSLPDDQFMRMPADIARKFGTRLVAAAAKSEGKTGYEFLIEVAE